MAIHEAGHVVAAWYCTITLWLKVTLEPDPKWPGSLGRVATQHEQGSSAHVWCLGACGLAGIAAELMVEKYVAVGPTTDDLRQVFEMLPKIAGSSPPWTSSGDSFPTLVELERHPFEVASDIAKAFGKSLSTDERIALFSIYVQARNLVHAHRERLLAVAQLLEERRTLTEDDLRPTLGPRFAVIRAGLAGPRFVPHDEVLAAEKRFQNAMAAVTFQARETA